MHFVKRKHKRVILLLRIDFRGFESDSLEVLPPNILLPQAGFIIDIFGDDIFETDEQVVITLVRPMLLLPEPFTSGKIPSPTGSVVKSLEDERIILDLRSTKLIIRSGRYM